MRIQYNGVELLVAKTNLWQRDSVYSQDGTDYLYTKHTLDVTAVYNPQATSYAQNPNPANSSPVIEAGHSPSQTDTIITRLLMTPQRTLTYTVGGLVVLQSPKGANQLPLGAVAVDALNGPKPLSCSVRLMGESKTWIVQWRVETWLSDCTIGYPDVDPLASNRWQTTHEIDDRDMTTLITRGVAVCKMDALAKLGPFVSFDRLRSRIFPRVPLGFARKQIHVSLNEIGNIITYQVVDRQEDTCLGSNLVAGTPAYLGVKSFRSACTVAIAPAQGAGTGDGAASVPGPFTSIAMDVQVIGHVAAAKSDLMLFAVKLCVERMNIKVNPNLISEPAINSVTATESVSDRSVSLRITGWLQFQAGKGALGLGPIPRQFLGVDRLGTFGKDGGLPGTPSAQKPYDNNTRGDWNVDAFAQAIQGACVQRGENNRCNIGDLNENDNYALCAPDIKVQIVAGDSALDPKTNRMSPVPETIFLRSTARSRRRTRSGRVPAPIGRNAPINPGGNNFTSTPPPSNSVEIMTLCLPTTEVDVHWECESVGSAPLFPSPVYNDPNYELLSWDVDTGTVQPIIADGDVLGYRVEGMYKYVMKKPLDPKGFSIFMGVVPWASISPAEATVDSSYGIHGFIDPPSGSSFSSASGPIGPNT